MGWGVGEGGDFRMSGDSVVIMSGSSGTVPVDSTPGDCFFGLGSLTSSAYPRYWNRDIGRWTLEMAGYNR